MIHHLASAASGFWEIIQPDETIRYIDSADKLMDRTQELPDALQTFKDHLPSSDRIRLRNQLSNMVKGTGFSAITSIFISIKLIGITLPTRLRHL